MNKNFFFNKQRTHSNEMLIKSYFNLFNKFGNLLQFDIDIGIQKIRKYLVIDYINFKILNKKFSEKKNKFKKLILSLLFVKVM